MISKDRALVDRYGADTVISRLAPLLVPEREALLKRVVGARRTDLTVLLDRFYDPHNNAAVLRSAEAFGLREVHVVPGPQGASFSSGVSQGVEKWIDHRVHSDSLTACDYLQAQGYTLVGADVTGSAQLPQGRVCLVMGAEKHGLSDEVRKRLTATVTIPMVGMVESFNVSVAAALLMMKLCERPARHLEEDDARVLLARYMIQSVQKSDVVLEQLDKR